MVTKCTRCGTQNKDEAVYCISCGNPLAPAKTAPSVKVVTPIAPGAVLGVPTSTIRVPSPGMCFYHTNLRASYVCNRCGRTICRDCAKAYVDLVMCPVCHREVAPAVPTEVPPPSASATPVILTVIGGIAILAHAIGILVWPPLAALAIGLWLGIPINWVVILGVVSGFGVIAGGLVSYQPGYGMAGGIITMLLSILSLLAGGGIIVGFILSLIGGVLAISRR